MPPFTSDPSTFYSTPNFQASANQLLQRYGLAMPSPEQINPNIFFSKDFGSRHPRLVNAVEGAILGGAFTRPAATPGEGINNVMQGLLDAKNYRMQHVANQYMQPFQLAAPLAQLQHLQDQHDTAQAQAELARKHAAYYGSLPEIRDEQAFLGFMEHDRPTGAGWEPDMSKRISLYQKFRKGGLEALTPEETQGYWKFNPDAAKAAYRYGGGTLPERRVAAEDAAQEALDRAKASGDPAAIQTATANLKAEIARTNRMNDISAAQAGGRAGAGADASTRAKQNLGDLPEELRMDIDTISRDFQSQLRNPEKDVFWKVQEVLADPAWHDKPAPEQYAESQRRVRQHNEEILAERDRKIDEAKERYRRSRGRRAVVPSPKKKPAGATHRFNPLTGQIEAIPSHDPAGIFGTNPYR